MTEPRAYMRHIREVKLCARGAREFAKRNGIDWSDFLQNGVPCSTLEATGDSFALKVAELARGSQNGQ
jgi:hypothetical protein